MTNSTNWHSNESEASIQTLLCLTLNALHACSCRSVLCFYFQMPPFVDMVSFGQRLWMLVKTFVKLSLASGDLLCVATIFPQKKIDLKIVQNHPDLHVNIGLRYGWWRALGPWGWCLFGQALGKEINASKVHVCNQSSGHCCITGKRVGFFYYFHHQLIIFFWFATFQFMMNVKLIQQSFLPRDENQIIRMIPTIL